MGKESRLISGGEIYQTELKKVAEHKDYRGSFSEIFQEYWNTCIEPVQWSLVKSKENVFRGMHLHKRHDEYFCLLTGHCFLGLKDIRPGSPTEGVHSLYELFEEDLAALAFPKGLLHGWYFDTPSIHVQAVSEAYVDYGKDDNWGVIWNAPDLGIPWPMDDAILSQRAQDFPTEAELKASLGDWKPFEEAREKIQKS
ncbi:dTDP-4-dehydrorhamnose 3,5-epimerase family protein [Rhodohalobacter sp. 614A]|uniref:dTDP-4-dehydrorhamnose 3,5-epimerase family protein n=1 Tax=Rhodohalobacter sp. 614A TaxID=2908649 RepID=UPI001F38A326|nr:dTDP-4-dehydrorhamnose 3,5-epimerase family protein [Rhodohalobacter sp. 614A]